MDLESVFLSVPIDVLRHIFSYLDIQSIVRNARVCKTWLQVSHDPSLWSELYRINKWRGKSFPEALFSGRHAEDASFESVAIARHVQSKHDRKNIPSLCVIEVGRGCQFDSLLEAARATGLVLKLGPQGVTPPSVKFQLREGADLRLAGEHIDVMKTLIIDGISSRRDHFVLKNGLISLSKGARFYVSNITVHESCSMALHSPKDVVFEDCDISSMLDVSSCVEKVILRRNRISSVYESGCVTAAKAASYVVIEHNEIYGSLGAGLILLKGDSLGGSCTQERFDICENVLRNNSNGLVIQMASFPEKCRVRSNDIGGNRNYGIYVDRCDDTQLDENHIHHNISGVVIVDSNGVKLDKCTMSYHSGPGLLATGCQRLHFASCVLRSNEIGSQLEHCQDCEFIKCDVRSNKKFGCTIIGLGCDEDEDDEDDEDIIFNGCTFKQNVGWGVAIENISFKLKECVVSDNDGCGVQIRVSDCDCAGILRDCQIYDNTQTGLTIEGARVRIIEGRIFSNRDDNVFVQREADCYFSKCTVESAPGSGICVEDQCHIEIKNCKMMDNIDGSLVLGGKAQGIVKGTTFFNNVGLIVNETASCISKNNKFIACSVGVDVLNYAGSILSCNDVFENCKNGFHASELLAKGAIRMENFKATVSIDTSELGEEVDSLNEGILLENCCGTVNLKNGTFYNCQMRMAMCANVCVVGGEMNASLITAGCLVEVIQSSVNIRNMQLTSSSGCGVEVAKQSILMIKDSQFVQQRCHSVLAFDECKVDINGCRFSANAAGSIDSSRGTSVAVEDCRFHEIAQTAVKIDSGHCTIQRNIFTNCNSVAIQASSCSGSVVGNKMENTESGILVTGQQSSLEISENTKVEQLDGPHK